MTGLLDLAQVALAFFERPATIHSYSPGAYVDGRWVESAPVSIDTKAVIQAPTTADLLRQPEGERIDGGVIVWCRSQLRAADEDAGTQADEVITPEGQVFKVIRVVGRSEAGLWRAYCKLVREHGRRV